MGDPQTLYVCSVSAPSKAGRAGVFLSLNVSKSGGRQMELIPSKGSFSGSKEFTKHVRGDSDMLLPTKVCFLLTNRA